jgi:hypothetical protein
VHHHHSVHVLEEDVFSAATACWSKKMLKFANAPMKLRPDGSPLAVVCCGSLLHRFALDASSMRTRNKIVSNFAFATTSKSRRFSTQNTEMLDYMCQLTEVKDAEKNFKEGKLLSSINALSRVEEICAASKVPELSFEALTALSYVHGLVGNFSKELDLCKKCAQLFAGVKADGVSHARSELESRLNLTLAIIRANAAAPKGSNVTPDDEMALTKAAEFAAGSSGDAELRHSLASACALAVLAREPTAQATKSAGPGTAEIQLAAAYQSSLSDLAPAHPLAAAATALLAAAARRRGDAEEARQLWTEAAAALPQPPSSPPAAVAIDARAGWVRLGACGELSTMLLQGFGGGRSSGGAAAEGGDGRATELAAADGRAVEALRAAEGLQSGGVAAWRGGGSSMKD